jgi:hypothetical protein
MHRKDKGESCGKNEQEIQEALKKANAEIAQRKRDSKKEGMVHWVDNPLDAEILRPYEMLRRPRNEIRAYSIFRSKNAPRAFKLLLAAVSVPVGLMLITWIFMTVCEVKHSSQDGLQYMLEGKSPLRQRAERGDVSAQIRLAEKYQYEWRSNPDSGERSAHWYKRAALKGAPEAQYRLGRMYLNGDDVPQDYRAAREWIQLAADQGYAPALRDLRWMHEKGMGRGPNTEKPKALSPGAKKISVHASPKL